jgi:serine/threonine protein kinase
LPDNPLPFRHQFDITGEDCNTFRFDIDERYYPQKLLGQGVTGVVIKALDTACNPSRLVAIKKVEKAFSEDLKLTKSLLREMRIMGFCHHENVVSILDVLDPPLEQQFTVDEIYMVMEYMDTDLRKVILDNKQDISPRHTQFFMWQALSGLEYLHSLNILHRDLKPSNLLITGDCTLKICDFGLSRNVLSGQENLTEDVVSRPYRCPEILLGCSKYDGKIDTWSMGCIFAELLRRELLFNVLDDSPPVHLDKVFSLLGSPSDDELSCMANDKAAAFYARRAATMPASAKIVVDVDRNLKALFPTADSDTLDLLKGLLAVSPQRRLSATQALRHPFFDDVRRLLPPPALLPPSDPNATAPPCLLHPVEWWESVDPARRSAIERFIADALQANAADPEPQKMQRDCTTKFQLTDSQYLWILKHLTSGVLDFEGDSMRRPYLRELLWKEIVLHRPWIKSHLKDKF